MLIKTRILHYVIQTTLIVSVFCSISCQEKKGNATSLNSALELAGENRSELEKVLSRYGKSPGDSLKYKAACFLIENMPYYSYYEGELLDNYLTYFHLLNENKKNGISPLTLSDSIIGMFGHFSLDYLQQKKDIQEIDSAYLCNNIEWAFKVWQEQPWGKNVSFDDFCEYILPYRIGDEKPEYWRKEFYEKYNDLLDPLRYPNATNSDDPISAVHLLMQHIAKKEDVCFTTIAPTSLPHVGASVSLFKSGSCRELTDYAIYVCRALGIPCHIDFMPIRGNDNVGHFWLSYYDKNKELYAQDFPDGVRKVRTNGIQNDPKTKVYRYTYSLNKKMNDEMHSLETSLPQFFEHPTFIDVTYPYAKYYIEKFCLPASKIYNKNTIARIAYLCSSQFQEWVPVAWTKFDQEGLIFNDIQKGDIMRIATWKDNRLVLQSDPFRIDPYSNEVTFYSCKDSLQDILLYSKCETWSETPFRDRMLGGVFEGSNDINFTDKDTLFLINQVPERLNIKLKVKLKNKYRYVRYRGANGTYCNVSEVAFYESTNDTIPLRGRIIGTPGSFDPHEYTNVFDGKTWTSFDYEDKTGGWTGLDLGKPKIVSQITYSPRNRDNYIRPKDEFELYYCDKEWKSLGVKVSNSDSLVYKNVPRDVILYLDCHNRGRQERIFTFENGKQIWR